MKNKIILIVIFCCSLSFENRIVSAQTVTADSIIQTSPCAGSNIYIPYTVSGGNFNFGNVFTAQLSDATGSFNNPANIGTLPYWSSGLIIGTIPASATFSVLYKVRIISSTPSDTSAPGPNNVIVTTIAQIATVVISPDDTICQGDSATLTVITPAQDYVWSTGETTQSITVSQSGIFTVTVTDLLGCKTVSSPVNIIVLNCNPGIQNIFSAENTGVYPNPFSTEAVLEIKDAGIGVVDFKLEIYNIFGQLVSQSQIHNRKSTIQRDSHASGIYFYQIKNSAQIIGNGKIIIQ